VALQSALAIGHGTDSFIPPLACRLAQVLVALEASIGLGGA